MSVAFGYLWVSVLSPDFSVVVSFFLTTLSHPARPAYMRLLSPKFAYMDYDVYYDRISPSELISKANPLKTQTNHHGKSAVHGHRRAVGTGQQSVQLMLSSFGQELLGFSERRLGVRLGLDMRHSHCCSISTSLRILAAVLRMHIVTQKATMSLS